MGFLTSAPIHTTNNMIIVNYKPVPTYIEIHGNWKGQDKINFVEINLILKNLKRKVMNNKKV